MTFLHRLFARLRRILARPPCPYQSPGCTPVDPCPECWLDVNGW